MEEIIRCGSLRQIKRKKNFQFSSTGKCLTHSRQCVFFIVFQLGPRPFFIRTRKYCTTFSNIYFSRPNYYFWAKFFLFDSSIHLVHRQCKKIYLAEIFGAKFKLTHQPSLKTSISDECDSNQNFYHELDGEQSNLQIHTKIYYLSFSLKQTTMFRT